MILTPTSGLMTYITLNGLLYITKLVSFGRIVPKDADLQEYWTWKPSGGHAPWFIRAASANEKFWSQGETRVQVKSDAGSENDLVIKRAKQTVMGKGGEESYKMGKIGTSGAN